MLKIFILIINAYFRSEGSMLQHLKLKHPDYKSDEKASN